MFLTFPGLSLQLSICHLSDSRVFLMKINRNSVSAAVGSSAVSLCCLLWSSECLDNVPCKVSPFLVKGKVTSVCWVLWWVKQRQTGRKFT